MPAPKEPLYVPLGFWFVADREKEPEKLNAIRSHLLAWNPHLTPAEVDQILSCHAPRE